MASTIALSTLSSPLTAHSSKNEIRLTGILGEETWDALPIELQAQYAPMDSEKLRKIKRIIDELGVVNWTLLNSGQQEYYIELSADRCDWLLPHYKKLMDMMGIKLFSYFVRDDFWAIEHTLFNKLLHDHVDYKGVPTGIQGKAEKIMAKVIDDEDKKRELRKVLGSYMKRTLACVCYFSQHLDDAVKGSVKGHLEAILDALRTAQRFLTGERDVMEVSHGVRSWDKMLDEAKELFTAIVINPVDGSAAMDLDADCIAVAGAGIRHLSLGRNSEGKEE